METKTFNLLGNFSYSRLEKYLSCPYAYKLSYVDGNFVSANSLAIHVGTLLHKVNEYICLSIINNKKIDYDKILDFIDNAGVTDVSLDMFSEKKDSGIKGVNILKREFFEEWFSTNTKSSKSMKQKIDEFKERIHDLENEFKNSDWEPYKVEDPFEFKFNGVTFKGFIDRIDKHKVTGALRVIDYKTKDAKFNEKELTTPLQFVVYAMAIMNKYGQTPESFIYDLPLIGEKQEGGTKGFIARGEKKMSSILESIEKEDYKPTPSPLCYWCNFCCNNSNAVAPYNKMCKYYSLWTPTNKTFEVNCKYGSLFILKP